MEYASKATGGTALGLGIAGTAGWLLNGGLGNLFGGLGGNGVVAPAVAGLAIGGVLLKPRVGKLVDALCGGKLHEAGGQGEE